VALVFSPERKLLERVPVNERFDRTLEAWVRVGLGEIAAEKVQDSVAVQRHVEKSPAEKEYEKLLSLARIMAQRKMYPNAVDHYGEAAAMRAPEAAPHREAGFVLLKMKSYDKAEKSFREALKRAPQDVESAAGLGLALHGQGKDEEALGELQDAMATLRPLPEVFVALAEIHLAAGRKDEALQMYRRGVERYSTEVDRCLSAGEPSR
ncbi:MAG TPA: tetratricopeptide repeat protein, partial [Verrucomicrobiae bacterium]|nr:tetratricopeptide repeat protein [Verrucomicrobiae bacterium]